MHKPESHITMIVPITAAPGPRPPKGKFFRTPTGIGVGAKSLAKKGVRPGGYAWPKKPGRAVSIPREDGGDHRRLAFGLLYLFTLLLYARPNDLIPAMGTFPLAKIVAILAPLAYVYAQYKVGDPIIKWTIEVKMVIVMLLLAVIITPFAASPGDSVATLNEVFIKTVIIFMLIIGVVNTRERLLAMIKLSALCGTWLAVFAIKNYATGNFTMKGDRIEGLVGGMFGNPNDLAAALNMLIPLAVTLALMSAGGARLLYGVCALLLFCGVMVTSSRAGFITLAAISGVMLWKFGRGSRPSVTLATLAASVLLFSVFSGAYRSRLMTIFDPSSDASGSAQQRTALLERGLDLSLRHPIIGLGMGNFHIYSIREKVAHNGYVETAAELGMIGLLAYLIIILAPLRGLAKIERQRIKPGARADLDAKYLSIGLQTALIAYMINSFFLSIQYLWYLYYAAGFAVALRLIYAAEKAAQGSEGKATAPSNRIRLGNLWKPAPLKPAESLWPAYRMSGNPAVREGAISN
ncbi:MAG TPA: O-antigen ligase family protein [Blastocatellia bacterium]|nr:O-antigen ligase family protein [Blastocatellia bacterium]